MIDERSSDLRGKDKSCGVPTDKRTLITHWSKQIFDSPFCCFIEMRTTARAPTHPAKTTFVLLELCFLLGQKYNCCYFIHISNFICDFFQIKIILVTRLLDEAHLKYVASSSVRVLHLKYNHTIILIWQ